MSKTILPTCEKCKYAITIDTDGGECSTCRRFTHSSCRKPGVTLIECAACGLPGLTPAPMTTTDGIRSVSKVCPKCQHTEFSLCKPNRMVAFAKDRKCKKCKTIYSVPTPLWAASIFVLAGLLLLAGGGFGLFANVIRFNPCGIVTMSALAAGGFFATVHGCRSLFKPGQV